MRVLPRTTGRLLVVCLFVLAVSGCGGSSKGSPERATPVIPGGAELATRAGAPTVCAQLTASKELRALASALEGWAQDPPDESAVSQLRDAGVALQQLADKADEHLAPNLRSAGRVLERVAAHRATRRSVSELAGALRGLGRKLEGPCGYPLG
jgi:hypothetical protein